MAALLRLWLTVGKTRAARRRRKVMRWAALEALCQRQHKLPEGVADSLVEVLESPTEHTQRRAPR